LGRYAEFGLALLVVEQNPDLASDASFGDLLMV